MKIRDGFVSNSSSSSFSIPLSALSTIQIYLITNYKEVIEKIMKERTLTDREKEAYQYVDEGWSIKETEHTLQGDTIMDNFDMHQFLGDIGVPMREIHWDDQGGW